MKVRDLKMELQTQFEVSSNTLKIKVHLVSLEYKRVCMF